MRVGSSPGPKRSQPGINLEVFEVDAATHLVSRVIEACASPGAEAATVILPRDAIALTIA